MYMNGDEMLKRNKGVVFFKKNSNADVDLKMLIAKCLKGAQLLVSMIFLKKFSKRFAKMKTATTFAIPIDTKLLQKQENK